MSFLDKPEWRSGEKLNTLLSRKHYAVLRLRHTAPARGRHRGLTRTTVRDQLSLLTDLASARSPLWPGSRSLALRLM